MTAVRPFVVGIGGTTRAGSASQRALDHCLGAAAALGADTQAFGPGELDLPLYAPDGTERTGNARALVAALARADGVLIVSPGYHGGVSGMIKNALDYVEDLREDSRPYLDGRAVGCVACASGWQAPATTLVALRAIVHALRGWPTPLGVAMNSTLAAWDEQGTLLDPAIGAQLELVARQVVEFARGQAGVS